MVGNGEKIGQIGHYGGIKVRHRGPFKNNFLFFFLLFNLR